MGNIQQVNSTDIIRAINNSDIIDVFNQKIFLTDSTVAGTSYVEDIEDIEGDIEIGDRLDFYREKENKYDEKAILVKHNNHKIGYVPRQQNEVLANLMDAGKLIFGEVRYVEPSWGWLRVDMDIYLDD
jgi:hypothetical protein